MTNTKAAADHTTNCQLCQGSPAASAAAAAWRALCHQRLAEKEN